MAADIARGDEAYVLRSGAEALERLALLDRLCWPFTADLLSWVGADRGSAVLDAGCGSGLLALRIAELVGPDGSVTGCDVDDEALSAARAAASEGGATANFVHWSVLEPPTIGGFDVVHARFLLSHLRDPGVAAAHLVAAAEPGGRVALQDVDLSGVVVIPPYQPAHARHVELYVEAARARGGNPFMGPELPRIARDAGLAGVDVALAHPLFTDGHEGVFIHTVTMEAIRPAVVTAGLASDDEIDGIIEQMRWEATRPGFATTTPRVVQAWGHVPIRAPVRAEEGGTG